MKRAILVVSIGAVFGCVATLMWSGLYSFEHYGLRSLGELMRIKRVTGRTWMLSKANGFH